MTDEKWRSPTGHSIASHETDKLPPKGERNNDVQAALGEICNECSGSGNKSGTDPYDVAWNND